MNLIELVSYLRNSDRLGFLFNKLKLDTQTEALLIYLKNDLNLESEIAIFKLEETEDDILFVKKDQKYIQLFPFDFAIELINSILNLNNTSCTDLDIAKRLLEYRINDA